MYKKSFAIPSG